MALNSAAVSLGLNGITAVATHLALHTAAPDATGSNQSAAARVAAAWSASTAGSSPTSTSKNFTGGAASGPCTHVGFWSAATGGTFYGSQALTGDQAFNAAGQYTTNTVTLTGSAT